MIHPCLIHPEIIAPGPMARDFLKSYPGARHAPLDELKAKGVCAWCNVVEVTDRRKKYCSSRCRDSAHFSAYPKSGSVRMWLLIDKQGCKCATCGFDFTTKIQTMIENAWSSIRRHQFQDRAGRGLDGVPYWFLGDSTGDKWEIDHIVPIHLGGDGIGLTNVQAICIPCHRKKSAKEAYARATQT